MGLTDRASLNEQFPKNRFIHALIETTDIDRCVLISFGDRDSRHREATKQGSRSTIKARFGIVLGAYATSDSVEYKIDKFFLFHCPIVWLFRLVQDANANRSEVQRRGRTPCVIRSASDKFADISAPARRRHLQAGAGTDAALLMFNHHFRRLCGECWVIQLGQWWLLGEKQHLF